MWVIRNDSLYATFTDQIRGFIVYLTPQSRQDISIGFSNRLHLLSFQSGRCKEAECICSSDSDTEHVKPEKRFHMQQKPGRPPNSEAAAMEIILGM
jgi:hypothetical protein